MDHFIETVRKYPCLWNTTAIEYRDQELKDAAWAEVMKETDLSSVKEVKLKWKKLRDSYRDALKRQSEMLAKDPSNPVKKNYPWKYMGLMQFLQPYMSNRKKPTESPSYPPSATPHENGLPHSHSLSLSLSNGAGERSSSDSESSRDSSPKRKSCERLTVIDRKLDYLCKAHDAAKRRCTEAHHQHRRRTQEQRALPSPATLTPLAAAAAAEADPLDMFFNSMCQATKRLLFPAQIKIKRVLFEAVMGAEETLLAEQQSYASLWARGAGSSTTSDAPDHDADDDGDGEGNGEGEGDGADGADDEVKS